jgi:solute carrier family 25 (mitochondrial aspartate/glutamate transporter), member 12/13
LKIFVLSLISFPEFHAFEGLLCVPDALYKTAFQLFDTNGNGMVAFGKLQKVVCSIFILI